MQSTQLTSPSARPVNDRLLNEREVAAIFGLTVRALQNWRLRGGGPSYVKVSSRAVRYKQSVVLQWIDDRTVSSTSDNPNA